MENTMSGSAARTETESDRPARQHSIGSGVKLWLLWLAVGLPMLWGVMKALEDVRNLFQ
jgi:hypothetical protein